MRQEHRIAQLRRRKISFLATQNERLPLQGQRWWTFCWRAPRRGYQLWRQSTVDILEKSVRQSCNSWVAWHTGRIWGLDYYTGTGAADKQQEGDNEQDSLSGYQSSLHHVLELATRLGDVDRKLCQGEIDIKYPYRFFQRWVEAASAPARVDQATHISLEDRKLLVRGNGRNGC